MSRGSVGLRRPGTATERRPTNKSTSAPEGEGHDPGGSQSLEGNPSRPGETRLIGFKT